MRRIKDTAPHRLIVEGKDDLHSIIHLTKRHGLDWDDPPAELPYVHDAGGIDEVMESIVTSAKSFERLGVVVDADHSVDARWQSVRARFASLGVDLPVVPDPDGTVLNCLGRPRRVGVWLMPANDREGKLEDFLATLVPADDACWAHAGAASLRARELGAAFSEPDTIKAQVHTWLSWQPEPGRALGTAITSCYFNHDSAEALKFVAWFRRLFLE